MKFTIIILAMNLLFLSCSSNDESSPKNHKKSNIEHFIEQEKYVEARKLIEEKLIQDPYDEAAIKQCIFVNNKLHEKYIIMLENLSEKELSEFFPTYHYPETIIEIKKP